MTETRLLHNGFVKDHDARSRIESRTKSCSRYHHSSAHDEMDVKALTPDRPRGISRQACTQCNVSSGDAGCDDAFQMQGLRQ